MKLQKKDKKAWVGFLPNWTWVMIYEKKSGNNNLYSDVISQTLGMNPNENDHMKIHLKELWFQKAKIVKYQR